MAGPEYQEEEEVHSVDKNNIAPRPVQSSESSGAAPERARVCVRLIYGESRKRDDGMCSGYRRLRTCRCWKLALLVSSSSHGRRPRFYSDFLVTPPRTHQIRIFTERLLSFSDSLIFIPTPGGAHLDLNQEEDVALFYVLQPDSYFLRLIYGNWFDFILC